MTYPATSRATELLGFIEAYSQGHGGLAPSYNEMRVHLGLSAKSGVHRLLRQLEERGKVRRLPNRARAVEVASCPAINIPPALYQKAKLKAEQAGERLDDIVTDFLRFFIDSE